jgi:hypothetical protein
VVGGEERLGGLQSVTYSAPGDGECAARDYGGRRQAHKCGMSQVTGRNHPHHGISGAVPQCDWGWRLHVAIGGTCDLHLVFGVRK